MKAQDVFDYFGGIREAAEALGLSGQALYKWKKSGEVPKTRQSHVEAVSKGRLKKDKPVYGLTRVE